MDEILRLQIEEIIKHNFSVAINFAAPYAKVMLEKTSKEIVEKLKMKE